MQLIGFDIDFQIRKGDNYEQENNARYGIRKGSNIGKRWDLPNLPD